MNKSRMFSVRLSPQEYYAMRQKCDRAGISCSDYIRAAIRDRDVTIIEGLPEMVLAVNRIGNNINQIAKAVNYGLLTGAESDLRKAVADLSDMRKELLEIGKRVDICR